MSTGVAAQQLPQDESIRVVDLPGAQRITGAAQLVAGRKQCEADPRTHATRRQPARGQPREIERTESQPGVARAPRRGRCRAPVVARCVCMVGRACKTMLASCALNVLLNHHGVASRRHDRAGEYPHCVV